MTHNNLLDYFKNLVTLNADLKSFYRLDITEIQGAMRNGIEYPALAIESHEIAFTGSTANNSLKDVSFAFTILHKPEQQSFDQENNALNLCEEIGTEILKRLRYDAVTPNSPLYQAFELSTITGHKVGPIYVDQLFGYRFEIPLKPKKIDMKITPDKWSDIDQPCP